MSGDRKLALHQHIRSPICGLGPLAHDVIESEVELVECKMLFINHSSLLLLLICSALIYVAYLAWPESETFPSWARCPLLIRVALTF